MQRIIRITVILFLLSLSLETTAAGRSVPARIETAFQEDCLKVIIREIKTHFFYFRRDGVRYVGRLLRYLKWRHFKLVFGYIWVKLRHIFSKPERIVN